MTAAEIGYRERCVREFEWRARRKAQLEEDARNLRVQLELEERERQQQLEQARDEAASLRRASDIRAYVDAVNAAVRGDNTSISFVAIERWSKWPLRRNS